jgi:2-dehydro-3-deoxyphosphogluconate aldolase/(4S)-4-hydroxy-2-oxoglutarate aldolase
VKRFDDKRTYCDERQVCRRSDYQHEEVESMKRHEVRACIEEFGILPSVRVSSRELALFAAETLYSAGIPVVEITMTTPGALEIIDDLVKHYPDMAVGAGTVLDEDAAHHCIDAGARFLTSPGFVPEVVAYANKVDVVVLPGALTPTEIIAAWKAGSDLIKIFPTGHIGGIQYLRALKVPLPQIPLIASGGVNQLTAFDFIQAGASAIGLGGELLPSEALHFRQQDRIHELANRFLGLVRDARALRDTYY